jgi:hypothetical protein
MNWLGIGKLALGAFGAIQSGKAAKQQAQASQTDLKKLRDDAQAAGFNPLTVLRATGGQGFNKGSSGALASATFWGNFANAGVSALNEFDPYNQKRKQLDIQQAQASLANTMASTQLMKIQTVAPLAADQSGPGGYGAVQTKYSPQPTPKMPNDFAIVSPPKIVPDGGSVPRQNYEQFPPFLGGFSMSSAPIQSTAAVEEAYGDAASWLYGPVIKFPADVYTTGILQGEAAARSSGSKYGFNNPARAKGLKTPQFIQDGMHLFDRAKTGQLSRQNFELMGK